MNIGTRVQLHPVLDAWMRGDRYGVLVRVNPDGTVRVKLDRSGRVVNLLARDVSEVVR